MRKLCVRVSVVGAMLLSIVGLILWPWRMLKKHLQTKSAARERTDS